MRSQRERLSGDLTAMGWDVLPSGANFVLFRVQADGQRVWEGLVAHGVLVRNFSRWPRLHDCLRVTVGTRDENDAFLEALSRVLTEVTS